MDTTKQPEDRFRVIGKPFKEEQPCPMSEADRHEVDRMVRENVQRIQTQENLKKATVAPITDKIKELKETNKKLLADFEEGMISRAVPMRWRADFSRGEKWKERMDGERPEEVPGSRTALTDHERQVNVPGTLSDGMGADELPVFQLPADEARALNPGADDPAAAAPALFQSDVPGFSGWRVEEHAAKPEEPRIFFLADSQAAWGPFEFDSERGFQAPGSAEDASFPEEAMTSLANHFGSVPEDQELTEKARAHALNLIKAAEAAVKEYLERIPPPGEGVPLDDDEDSTGTADGMSEGGLQLHLLDALAGWGFYVHEGRGYLRPPNVDQANPPIHPSDRGPLEWNAAEKVWDNLPGSTVDDAWAKVNESALKEIDMLVVSGRVKLDGAAEDEKGDDAPATDPQSIAAKLSKPARDLILEMDKPDAPTDTATLGARARCRAGSVLKRTGSKGLTTVNGSGDSAQFVLTDLGRAVAAILRAKDGKAS